MTTRCAVAFAACLSLAGPARLWAQPADGRGQAPAQPQAQLAGSSTSDLFGVSVARVKLALAGQVPPALRISPDQPTFRVDIVEKEKPFILPLAETLKIPWAPVSNTGSVHDEFIAMVTPPQARPYGAFVNGDLVQVVLTSFINKLLMTGAQSLITSGRDAYRSRIEQAIREQVQREFDEFLRAHPEAPRPVR